jgi:hypothetical protein
VRPKLSGTFTNFPVAEMFFGAECMRDLSSLLSKDKLSRAVVITSRSVAANRELMKSLQDAVGDRCAGIFFDTVPHVPRETAIAAAQFACERNSDGVISFGALSAGAGNRIGRFDGSRGDHRLSAQEQVHDPNGRSRNARSDSKQGLCGWAIAGRLLRCSSRRAFQRLFACQA